MKDIAPNNLNFVVGGIRAMFQLNKTGGYIDLGHMSENSIVRSVERGIYASDRSGVNEEIYTWLKKRGMAFEVTADETTKKSLQFALLADTPALQTQAAGSVVDEAFTAKLDRWVRLANRKVSAVVVTNSAATVTYVLGTDYEVDAELGAIRCFSSGAITADQALLVDYTKAVMTSLTTMNMLQTSRFSGDLILKMVAENGAVVEFYFPLVEVQPKGDLTINTDAPMKTGAFSIKVLKDTTATAGTEWGTFRELTAAV